VPDTVDADQPPPESEATIPPDGPSPAATHEAEEMHDTPKSWLVPATVSVVNEPPWNSATTPTSAPEDENQPAATQVVPPGTHDTEDSALVPETVDVDHPVPSKTLAKPSCGPLPTATQSVAEAQETESRAVA